MTALKGAQVDAFLARPDPARPVVLVFGPDAGLVRERAEALIRGAVAHWYPYPFIDITQLGYGGAAVNCVWVALLPPWYDVDTLADLKVMRGHLCALRQAGVDPEAEWTERIIQHWKDERCILRPC